MAREFTKRQCRVKSEPAQPKSKSKVKLNFGLSRTLAFSLRFRWANCRAKG